jgi:hypothetical protein
MGIADLFVRFIRMLCCIFVSWEYAKRWLMCFIEDSLNLLKRGRDTYERNAWVKKR